MVGDPMQLPPTVLSQRTKQALYSRSLFQVGACPILLRLYKAF